MRRTISGRSPRHRARGWAPLLSAVLAVTTVLSVQVVPGQEAAASTTAFACGVPAAPTRAVGDAEVAASYAAWKAAYVTSDGAGGFLRVKRPENSNDTVSEGIAYGMLVAAYQQDRTVLDGLWGYARSHRDANGLMHWRVDAQNRVTGHNAATDADEDMALALVVADRTWGGYRAEATAQIDRIMTHEVEPGTLVLKPGDAFGGSALTNPSYFAPGAYRVFADYTGDTRWVGVLDATYRMLDTLGQRTAAGTTGLVPDWMTAQGEPVAGYGFDYSYDAVRTPWRLATHAAWTCDARARAQVDKVSRFFSRVGPAAIKDGYRLDGTPTGQWHNASFVGPAGAAAVLSTDAAYRQAMWDETVAARPENYYNASLRLLSLLLMSGGMPSPSAVATPDPTASPSLLPRDPSPSPIPSFPPPSPSSSPPSNPSSTEAACAVSYVVRDRWDGGFVADVTLVNKGATLQGWTMSWTYPDGQRVTRAWNAAVSQRSRAVTASDVGWNGRLGGGASTTFGVQGTHRGSTATPVGLTVNGVACSS